MARTMYHVLHLGLSYACNMKCQHCFVKREKNLITESDIRKVIDALDKQGLFIVYYTYGEPLLSELFWKISSYLKKKKIVQVLMTNGTCLTENIADRLKMFGISSVYVSIDSADAANHDKNRCYPGAFESAIKAIRICREFDVKVNISTTVTARNVFEMNDILGLAIREGVSAVSFLRERQKEGICLFPPDAADTYNEFFCKVIQNRLPLNVKFHDPTLIIPLKKMLDNSVISETIYEKYFEMNSCHAHYTLSVDPGGVVRNCNLVGKPLGNILTTPIETILSERSHSYECPVRCSPVSQSGQ